MPRTSLINYRDSINQPTLDHTMWIEKHHIFVVETLFKVNCTMDMGNYTFTHDVYALDRKNSTRFWANVIIDEEQSKEVLTLRNLAGFLVAKTVICRSFLILVIASVHCTLSYVYWQWRIDAVYSATNCSILKIPVTASHKNGVFTVNQFCELTTNWPQY